MAKRSEDIKTPLARLAFAQNLIKPQTHDDGKQNYNGTLLFSKSDDISALKKAAVDVAVAEWGEKAVQWIKDGVIKNPFLDGDGPQAISKKTGERNQGFAGHIFLRAQANVDYPPGLFGRDRRPLANPSKDLYSGCYVYAVGQFYTWDHPKNGKGVSFGISMVQVARDGERLGGGGASDPEKFFEKIEDTGEAAPESTKTGSGAEGLFA